MSQVQIKQATLRDVADAAGVSYQTVWRVVNAHPHVAEKTRARVLEAVRKLDYRPHRAAQVLTTGRSHIFQLIIFEYAYGNPLPAILHWTREFGYATVVTELAEPTSVEAMRKVLSETSRMVDGVLMVMPYPHLSYAMLVDLCQGRPFVIANTVLGARIPSVVFDQRYGMQLSVQHLLDLGHRRIAEISGPLDNVDARARHETWLELLRQHGLTPGPSEAGDFEVYGGYAAARRLLARGWSFTAMVVGNDLMALGALRALREAGLRVPEDVSLVGFDDIPAAAYLDPPLTTVRQDFDALGRESVEYLVSLVEEPYTSVQQRVLYPELVVRQSTRSIAA